MASETPSVNGKALTPAQVHKQVQDMMAEMAMQVQGKVKQKSLPDDATFAKAFPWIWDWMTATQIRDSMEKDSARIVFTVEDSTWKATLSDNALRCSMTGVGITFDLALENLESLLGGKDKPWVRWKQRGKALRDILPTEPK